MDIQESLRLVDATRLGAQDAVLERVADANASEANLLSATLQTPNRSNPRLSPILDCKG